ncbi:CDP-alcohol phosphatidyltransferase family protein [Arthrobacter glacialis]|uniref:CDP-alcohol phosphatidyltransferase family protein n=1 Tax=Arthrobacter glacialis TaxID=1664 RepID=UPI001A9E6BC7|nr:CDP-alcohol phosphatidyltransferase family protein [Arthrobacter glacialis]
MRWHLLGPMAGLVSQLALLAVLASSGGLGGLGWGIGVVYAVTVCALLANGITRRGSGGFGPADWITQLRALLTGGAAALVADSFSGDVPVALLIVFAALTILLDATDGWVARRTGTTSALGARFDMEVDAFLIFALSVYVAPLVGVWVLLIGLARYAFVATGWFLPWLRASAPARYWSKVVAVVQGVVLTVAAADVLPRPLAAAALLTALVLLAESFGRESWWLWRHRKEHGGKVVVPSGVRTAAAIVVIWCVLVLPADPTQMTPVAFVSIPAAGLLIVLTALLLPRRWGQAIAVGCGIFLGCLLILKALNMAFVAVFGRAFDPVNDWFYLGPGAGVLGDSIGQAGALAVVVAAIALAVAALVLLPLAALRLSRAASHNRRLSARAAAAIGFVWVLLAVTGLQWSPDVPLASTSPVPLVSGQLRQLQLDLADRKDFAAQIILDPLDDGPRDGLLEGLRGKDVMLVFVESYGRSALSDPAISPGVKAVLKAGTKELEAAGFSSLSAFLTSPTFGGASWLAHSTLQSGLWVDSQQRYNQLLTTDRMTLSGAFSQAGWRTVFDVPANTLDWPQGQAFYHFDALYDSRNVGYRGPKFSYATMPDQYVLSAFARLELAKQPRTPVMAELDLVSSHTPWTPLPSLVPWGQVGDGSIFNPMAALGPSPESVVSNPELVKTLYGKSIEYSLAALFSFVRNHPDPNLVLIVLGDHQPAAAVSGQGASHDVPISIIAHDKSVLGRISSWGWDEGALPDPSAPVMPMSEFRDSFLTAYSQGASAPVTGSTPTLSPAAVPGDDVVPSPGLPSPE